MLYAVGDTVANASFEEPKMPDFLTGKTPKLPDPEQSQKTMEEYAKILAGAEQRNPPNPNAAISTSAEPRGDLPSLETVAKVLAYFAACMGLGWFLAWRKRKKMEKKDE